jgi:hypothetical protein
MNSLYRSAIPLPDVYSRGILKDVLKKTYAGIFIAALFLTVKKLENTQVSIYK